MAEKSSVLYCEYVIDGVSQGVSPGRMLDECLIDIPAVPHETSGKIVDETVDLAPSTYKFDSALIMTYLDLVKKQLEKKRHVPIHFADSYAAGKVAESLLDAIWMTGHFRMGDLTLRGDWHWDREPIGNMAAFYRSVEAATGYIDELGVRLRSYSVLSGQCSISFKAATTSEEEVTEDEEEIIIRELPFKTANPRIGRRRKCPSTFRPDNTDWLIYIPFDQCDYRLGGWDYINIFNDGSSITDTSGNPVVEEMDHWTTPGVGNISPAFRYNYGSNHDWNSTRSLWNTTYVQLRSLSIGYRLPESITRRMSVNSCMLSLIGDNLYLWTPAQRSDRNSYKTLKYSDGMRRGLSFQVSLSF